MPMELHMWIVVSVIGTQAEHFASERRPQPNQVSGTTLPYSQNSVVRMVTGAEPRT